MDWLRVQFQIRVESDLATVELHGAGECDRWEVARGIDPDITEVAPGLQPDRVVDARHVEVPDAEAALSPGTAQSIERKVGCGSTLLGHVARPRRPDDRVALASDR
jgi:hypothetical protein